jgi:hypothetical protein
VAASPFDHQEAWAICACRPGRLLTPGKACRHLAVVGRLYPVGLPSADPLRPEPPRPVGALLRYLLGPRAGSLEPYFHRGNRLRRRA